MTLRSAAKTAALAALDAGGAHRITAIYRQRRMLVACYHGVIDSDRSTDPMRYLATVSAAEFSTQLETLGAWFEFVDLAGAARWLASGSRSGKPPVLITFDDGYRNNLTIAAPILRKYCVPAVFFLTTGYIGGERLLWPLELEARIFQADGGRIPVPLSRELVSVPKESAGRLRLAHTIRTACKTAPNAERLRYLQELRAATTLDPERIDHEVNDFLTWDEVRRLAAMGFDIGSHTVEHPILSRLPSEELDGELSGSRTRLSAETGRSMTALAYPNGGPEDYDAAVCRAASEAGYKLAFAVGDRFAERRESPMEIHRMIIAGHLPPRVFRFIASGCRDLLRA